MAQLVVLNLGKGDWDEGCSHVVAQLWRSDSFTPMQFIGSLPPLPQLGSLYSHWQQLYRALYSYKGWRHIQPANSGSATRSAIDINEDDITHISEAEFVELCQHMRHCLNRWLTRESFLPLERQLRTRLDPADEIRFIITAENRQLLRLPWCLWQFVEDYPRAEIALSLPEYNTSVKTATTLAPKNVKILAILGNSHKINVTRDQQLLEQLPHTDLRLLVEPDTEALNQQLWDSEWDVLFFAGHSSTQKQGQIQINPTDSLTLEQLRHSLKRAIARGLKLAIFNSCDGLGLAWDLADLQIPQVIVMREPVPDRVAQEFLKYFLIAFSGGQSLYLAMREARERLQALENDFPCATWLPIICQNPAELPQTWQEWRGATGEPEVRDRATETRKPSPHSSLLNPVLPNTQHPTPNTLPRFSRTVLTSVVATVLVFGVRSLGILQPVELWAFDQLLRHRPAELPDSRLLIVTINEADIQAQDPEHRRGSLSDAALVQLLETLEQHQARVIGLDIYRDFPVHGAYPTLATQLQQNNRFIAICKSSNRHYDPIGSAPPPEVPKNRVGFSDFLEDEDGVLRRQLLFMTPDPASPCPTPYAFSTQVALRYLQDIGISPQFTPGKNLKLNHTVFRRLMPRASGYQMIDARGSQLLLNYRALSSPDAIAPQVNLVDVLSGKIDPATIKDRIVLIGVTAAGAGDHWFTPYGFGPTQRIPGVMIQAQMISQIVSAVLDQRPLLGVWVWWIEGLWIWGWASVGGVVIGVGRSPIYQNMMGVAALGVLSGLSLLLLIQGIWVPLIPAGIGLVITGSMVLYLQSSLNQSSKKA